MDLPSAMSRYEQARKRSVEEAMSSEALLELAAARVALVDLLAADGWVPELRVTSQVERDMALLRTREVESAAPPQGRPG